MATGVSNKSVNSSCLQHTQNSFSRVLEQSSTDKRIKCLAYATCFLPVSLFKDMKSCTNRIWQRLAVRNTLNVCSFSTDGDVSEKLLPDTKNTTEAEEDPNNSQCYNSIDPLDILSPRDKGVDLGEYGSDSNSERSNSAIFAGTQCGAASISPVSSTGEFPNLSVNDLDNTVSADLSRLDRKLLKSEFQNLTSSTFNRLDNAEIFRQRFYELIRPELEKLGETEIYSGQKFHELTVSVLAKLADLEDVQGLHEQINFESVRRAISRLLRELNGVAGLRVEIPPPVPTTKKVMVLPIRASVNFSKAAN